MVEIRICYKSYEYVDNGKVTRDHFGRLTAPWFLHENFEQRSIDGLGVSSHLSSAVDVLIITTIRTKGDGMA